MDNEAQLWDKKYSGAREYSSTEDIFRFCATNPTLKEILPLVKDEENFKVLEIGSGTGELIFYIKNKNPKVNAFGLDFSEESIKRSKKVSDKFNLDVEFERGDISSMPYPDECFDIVYGDQVIGHVPDQESVLKEIYRVTRKGGLVALTAGNSLRLDGWYLNTKLSKNHQGYRQRNMFPWTLKSLIYKRGFKLIKFYGDMLFLFRNISLIKSYFIKKSNTLSPTSIMVENNKSKSLLKGIYYRLDNLFPSWGKVTVGVLVRK